MAVAFPYAKDGSAEGPALGMPENLAIELKEVYAELGEMTRGISSDFADFGSAASEAFGAALVSGENFGDAVTDISKRAIGDLAKQFGKFFVLQGTGLLFQPGGQAAGAGMIAAGVALNAFSGAVGAGGGGGPSQRPNTGVSDNFHRNEPAKAPETTIRNVLILDGEVVATSVARHNELGGRSAL